LDWKGSQLAIDAKDNGLFYTLDDKGIAIFMTQKALV